MNKKINVFWRLLLIGLFIQLTSCSKEEEKKVINYNLTFEASHHYTETNESGTGMGDAYYSFTIKDENSNSKFEKNGDIKDTTITIKATAKSGDWIYIYISVSDVYDYGFVSCSSTNDEILLVASTDNLYMDESDNVTARSITMNNNGNKKIGYQLK